MRRVLIVVMDHFDHIALNSVDTVVLVWGVDGNDVDEWCQIFQNRCVCRVRSRRDNCIVIVDIERWICYRGYGIFCYPF